MKRLFALVLVAGFFLSLTWDAMAGDPRRIEFHEFFASQETYQRGFGAKLDLELSPKLRELHGKAVELIGFMAGALPEDGSFFIALKEPVDQCPFCSQAFDWAGVATVFVKKGVIYMGGPLRIVGRLDIGRRVDETGFESYVRIYDATVTRYKP